MAAETEDFVFACEFAAVPARGKKTVTLGDRKVLIITCDSHLYAVEDRCPQTGRSIAHGKVLNCTITSPNNGAKYCLRTGKFLGGGQSPFQSHWLNVLQCKVVDDKVYVRIT